MVLIVFEMMVIIQVYAIARKFIDWAKGVSNTASA